MGLFWAFISCNSLFIFTIYPCIIQPAIQCLYDEIENGVQHQVGMFSGIVQEHWNQEQFHCVTVKPNDSAMRIRYGKYSGQGRFYPATLSYLLASGGYSRHAFQFLDPPRSLLLHRTV